MLRQVVEPKVSSVTDEHAEYSPAVRWIADLRLHVLCHPEGHETLKARSCWVDHAESCVMGIGDTGGGFDDTFQNAVERQLGVDRDPGLHQHPQAIGVGS